MRRLLTAVLIALGLAGLWSATATRGWEAGRLALALTRLEAVGALPERDAVTFLVDGRSRAADVYRPASEARAALVLVPGASPAGKDDPRFMRFADALRRAGLLVLAPDLPNLRALAVEAADAQAVGDAVRHLAATAPSGRQGVALAAISYAAGPAFIAASQPDMTSGVRLLVAVGGYYDLSETITFVTTGWHRDASGAWLWRAPNAYGIWVFLRSNAERLTDSGDRALLAAMAARRMADSGASLDDLAARLGPQGRPIYELAVNGDPARVPELMAALPPLVAEQIAELDLARRDLSGFAGRALLIHGRDDGIVPAGQSVALARALPPGRAELHLVESVGHVEPRGLGLAQAIELWRLCDRLLEMLEE